MLIIFKIETIINNRKKNIYRMLIKRTFEKYYSNKLFYILNCYIYILQKQFEMLLRIRVYMNFN